MKDKYIPLEVFEIVTSKNNNVLICFNGKMVFPDVITGFFDGNSLVLKRSQGPSIALKNIIEADIENIKNAESVLINRTNNEDNILHSLSLEK